MDHPLPAKVRQLDSKAMFSGDWQLRTSAKENTNPGDE